MKSVMDVLEESLSADGFQRLLRVASELDEPAFQYSPKRREFTPTDGWFLMEPQDGLSEEDEYESGPEHEDDDEEQAELMELAMTCCSILNAYAGELDRSGFVEPEPRLRVHQVTYHITDPALVERFIHVLKENGYDAAITDEVGETRVVEVPFRATTDWEHTKERENITTLYDMTRRHFEGKSTRGERL